VREIQNVLYVQTQGASLRLDHDALCVRVEGELRLRAPLLRLSGIVVFGRVGVTTSLIHRCAADGRDLVWLDRRGRFRGRLQGPVQGNVLLRSAQHAAHSHPRMPVAIARQMVAAKVQNGRYLLLRAARDARDAERRTALTGAAGVAADVIGRLPSLESLDALRGAEGEAARAYFGVLRVAMRSDLGALAPEGRSKRPPRDPVNSVLSFGYTLLRNECAGALEAVGLDPQVGYLHALRSGRPALALDLMEELRSTVVDRLVLTLFNRRELREGDFEALPGGAIYLTEGGRRKFLAAYQERKGVEVEHRLLGSRLALGLVPHVQARLLARHLRGELDVYPPFLVR
jgi:CRISPR-associated protein Cas1